MGRKVSKLFLIPRDRSSSFVARKHDDSRILVRSREACLPGGLYTRERGRDLLISQQLYEAGKFDVRYGVSFHDVKRRFFFQ